MSLEAKKAIIAYLAKIGAEGGKKSRRTLTSEQAKAMVRARTSKQKRAARQK